jgi:ubiquinone/menaquinone biosynthesis C-methylase UbiE
MTNDNEYIQKLEVSNPLLEPVVQAAIQGLQLPSGSSGVDAGCGIGQQALLLAEAVGPAGRVTGIDISPELLQHAETMAKKAGLSERIDFQKGDARKFPFADTSFDWAWSSCCVGYAASIEPLSAVKELARVVKPGGVVALFAWSSEQLLPGHPFLEARLRATKAGIAPFARGMSPERHFLCALGWFREVGLREPTARTFAGGASAPLGNEIRNALEALFEMRWLGVESELKKEDREEYRRLCLPESPDFILNRPDYYAFFTCSMFSGKVAR